MSGTAQIKGCLTYTGQNCSILDLTNVRETVDEFIWHTYQTASTSQFISGETPNICKTIKAEKAKRGIFVN